MLILTCKILSPVMWQSDVAWITENILLFDKVYNSYTPMYRSLNKEISIDLSTMV